MDCSNQVRLHRGSKKKEKVEHLKEIKENSKGGHLGKLRSDWQRELVEEIEGKL